MGKLTCEEYKALVRGKYGDKFTVIGDYFGWNNPIKIMCNVCGNIKEEEAARFLYRGKCAKCFFTARTKTHTEFLAEVKQKYGNEFDLITEYKGAKEKIRVKHRLCGNVYEIKADHLLRRGQCAYCQPSRVTSTYLSHYKKEFEEYVKENVGTEYEIIGTYENAEKPITMRHATCGYEWKVKPNKFKQGHRCPKCAYINVSDKLMLSQHEFNNRVSALYGDAYTVLSAYKGKAKTVSVRHNRCGHVWNPNAGNFLNGYGCPYCSESKGEKYIYQYLINNGVSFKTQYRIKECRDKLPLPFDFAIVNGNDLRMLIEYDGAQHYIEMPQRNLAYIRRHDRIKDKFCADHGIALTRIKYSDDLDKSLNDIFQR